MKNETDSKASTAEADAPLRHSGAREWYESLLVAGVFVLFVRTFIVQTYQVPTGSMESTILIGDHLLVNKFVFGPHAAATAKFLPYREVHRGDIIVFKKPGDDRNDNNVLVKRAVGGPSDVLQVKDKNLLVNGKNADGPWVEHIFPEILTLNDPRVAEHDVIRDQFGPYHVPDGHYFGMGDNRDNSYDSRFWGSIPRQNIFGRPFLLYWSYEAEPNSHIWRGPVDKARQLASVAIHFFTRTRWDRMFRSVR